MKTVEVIFKWEDGGTGVQYYRTIPSNQLICIVDEVWHTAIDDDTWNESCSPINMDMNNIVIVDDPEKRSCM